MKTIRILILEDDIMTCRVLLEQLEALEFEAAQNRLELSAVVLQEFELVERWVNRKDWSREDVVLLDRDCDKGESGSFHVLDFEKFDRDRIISISSVPEWNEEARERGISRIVLKDFTQIEEFGLQVQKELKRMLFGS